MTEPPTIVAIPSSLRAESYTHTAIQHARAAAEAAGAETSTIDLREATLPLYHPDEDDQGDSEKLTRIVREADGILLGSPVYHSSYSSTFRNLHDYCSYDEFEDTVVGLLVVAGGEAYAQALDHLRSTIRGVHGWVLPHQVGIPNVYEQFESDADAIDGRAFVDPDVEARVQQLGEQLVEHAAASRVPTAAHADD
jgi:NAD(P)H-dependent FMN reductase